jgi:hypothetical protein
MEKTKYTKQIEQFTVRMKLFAFICLSTLLLLATIVSADTTACITLDQAECMDRPGCKWSRIFHSCLESSTKKFQKSEKLQKRFSDENIEQDFDEQISKFPELIRVGHKSALKRVKNDISLQSEFGSVASRVASTRFASSYQICVSECNNEYKHSEFNLKKCLGNCQVRYRN